MPDAVRSALAGELYICDRIVRVSQVQHRRTLYFHRLRDVQKRLRASLLAAARPSSEVALKVIERALGSIDSAWLSFRHLLAQTYFMPLAITSLALLARAASLLVQLHSGLRLLYAMPNRGIMAVQFRPLLPRLLALAPVPAGVARGSTPSHGESCAADEPESCGATGDGGGDEDLGQALSGGLDCCDGASNFFLNTCHT